MNRMGKNCNDGFIRIRFCTSTCISPTKFLLLLIPALHFTTFFNMVNMVLTNCFSACLNMIQFTNLTHSESLCKACSITCKLHTVVHISSASSDEDSSSERA